MNKRQRKVLTNPQIGAEAKLVWVAAYEYNTTDLDEVAEKLMFDRFTMETAAEELAFAKIKIGRKNEDDVVAPKATRPPTVEAIDLLSKFESEYLSVFDGRRYRRDSSDFKVLLELLKSYSAGRLQNEITKYLERSKNAKGSTINGMYAHLKGTDD